MTPRVQKLLDLFGLPGIIGCTGSLLCGLENEASDIDMVVYGKHWFTAQELVRQGILEGNIDRLSPKCGVRSTKNADLKSRTISLYSTSVGNRPGQIEGTYFDILYTRSYDDLKSAPTGRDNNWKEGDRGDSHGCFACI